MRIVIYPGTFDPIHSGHIDIAERASTLFDKLIFAVAVNADKKPLFTPKERIEMIIEAMGHVQNVEAFATEGLVADFARRHKAVALIRGLRHVSDFEFEFQMALMNRSLNENISTLFLMPHAKYTHVSSSMVREVASLGGSVIEYVPSHVNKALKEKFGNE